MAEPPSISVFLTDGVTVIVVSATGKSSGLPPGLSPSHSTVIFGPMASFLLYRISPGTRSSCGVSAPGSWSALMTNPACGVFPVIQLFMVSVISKSIAMFSPGADCLIPVSVKGGAPFQLILWASQPTVGVPTVNTFALLLLLVLAVTVNIALLQTAFASCSIEVMLSQSFSLNATYWRQFFKLLST